ADVHCSGGGRSGACGKCHGLLPAIEERRGACRAAHLCAGRTWIRPAPHGVTSDHLAGERGDVAAYDQGFADAVGPDRPTATIVVMRLAVLTISDRCSHGLLTDTAGPA